MDKAKKDKDKNYYFEGIKQLLKTDETIDNYTTLYKEYKEAYNKRKSVIENLYNEIKIIKKLKV